MQVYFGNQDNFVTNAWVVRVEVDTIMGGRRITRLYAAMFPESDCALRIVGNGFPPKSRIELIGPLPPWTIARHALKRGEVRLLSARNRALGTGAGSAARRKRHSACWLP